MFAEKFKLKNLLVRESFFFVFQTDFQIPRWLFFDFLHW